MQDNDTVRKKYIADTKKVFNLKDWKNIPEIGDMQSNINSANDINKKYLDRIVNGLQVLGGELPKEFLNSLKPNQSKSSPKIAQQQAEWAYGKLTEPFHIANNLFKVDANHLSMIPYARQCERILNFQFTNSIPKRLLIDQAAKAFYDNGIVIGKVHWDSESVTESITTTTLVEAPDGTMNVKEDVVENTYLIENKPSIVLCDFNSVTIDPSCRGDLDKAMFITHKYKTNKANLIKDGRYKNLDKINVNENPNKLQGLQINDGQSDGNNPIDDMDFQDDNRKLFDIIEYWAMYDIYDTGILEPILVSFVGNVVVRVELSPMPDGKLPFVAKSMLIEENSVYGMPVSLLIKEEQQAIGNVHRNLLDKISQSMRDQKLIHPQLFSSSVEKQKFINGRSATTAGIVSPTVGLYEVENKGGLDNHLYQMLQSMKAEAQDITGNMPMTQTSGNKFNSSGALSAFVDTVAVRESMELGRFTDFWIEIAKKVLSMSLYFLEDEEIRFITGEEVVRLENVPKTISPISLSTNIITMSERRDKSIFFMSILERMDKFADPEFEGAILTKLAYINDSPDIASQIQEIINRPPPEPTPQEIARMELEFADMQADVSLKQAQAEDYLATAQLKTHRTAGEDAKAEYTFARADDLNGKIVDRANGKDLADEYARGTFKLENDLARDEQKQKFAMQEQLIKNLTSPKSNSLDPRK